MGLSFDVRRNQAIVAQALASALPPPSPSSLPLYDPSCQKAIDFHGSEAKIRALFGGNRASKSETGGFELVKKARQYPGETFWACAISVDKVKIVAKKIMKYLDPAEIKDIAWSNRSRRIPSMIRLTNEVEIEFKTYKSGVEAFAGESCRGIWLDEDPACAIPGGEEIFVEALQRTTDCGGQIWLTATPVLGKNWMYRRIFMQNNTPDIACWTVSLLENKHIPLEEKERVRRLMTEDEIERRFFGVFTTLEGAVFKELDEAIHYIPFFQIPCDWRIISGIDLGYVNAFCYLMAALSPDDELYFFAEHYQNEMLLKDHAQIIRKMELDVSLFTGSPMNLSGIPENRLCDHDRQERAELEECGIWTEAADKDVHFSIERINRLLKPKQNGRPSFFVMDSCPNLQREMQNYRYKEVRAGSEDKEQPIKENDHAVDAARYITLYCFPESMGGEIESAAPSVFGGLN